MGAPVLWFVAARIGFAKTCRTRGDRLDDCHYTFVLKPQFGMEAALASPAITESRYPAKLAVSGFVIDFMMVFFERGGQAHWFCSVWSLILHGTGSAKVINLMTNVTALFL